MNESCLTQIFPSEAAFNLEPLAESTHDVTNKPECISSCLFCNGPLRRTVHFGLQEMVQEDKNWCSHHKKRTPYGSLEGFEMEQNCKCAYEIDELGNPGWGCFNKAQAQSVAEDIQRRIEKKGQINQLLVQESLIDDILNIEVKIDVLTLGSGIAYPEDDIRRDNLS